MQQLNAVSIVNQALDQIGARATVTSVEPSDGTVAGDAAARNYQPRLDDLLRAAHWNCARMQQTLTLLKARAGTPENVSGTVTTNPPYPWLYEYACPTDPYMLKARYIVPRLVNNSGNTTVPLTTGPQLVFSGYGGANNTPPFIVSSDTDAYGNQIKVILTNMPQAELVYTARVEDPTLWDSMFTSAFVMYLAAWLARPVNGSLPNAQMCAQQSQALIMKARQMDGDEGTSVVDMTPDWIKARASGGGTGVLNSTVTWDALAFPNGEVF